MKKKIGLIVNPIAGMGGPVGLKGTDGLDTYKKALALGAEKKSPEKTIKALREIKKIKGKFQLLTFPHEMGENEAQELGIDYKILGKLQDKLTSDEDTKRAAKEMAEIGVDLIVFAGGDGTARNIYQVIKDKIPVVGIPTGVKIHSAVFGNNPVNSGKIIADFILDKNIKTCQAEVMDIDENKFRRGQVSARLYGYMKVPSQKNLFQSVKSGGYSSGEENLQAIAKTVVEQMLEDHYYIVGSGTTTRKIMEKLDLPNSLLGIDLIKDKKLVLRDANEEQIYEKIKDKKVFIIASIIGGQGYIFGRGNQQISPRIIELVGKEGIIIISPPSKLLDLKGKPMLVDTGDIKTDKMLKGYYKVVTGYNDYYSYKCQ